MQTGSPLWFLRHSVVCVVLQLAHEVPSRRAALCEKKCAENRNETMEEEEEEEEGSSFQCD